MGGWVEGDPAGDRRFLDLPAPFRPERGGLIPGVRVAYETWGTLDGDGGNAVLVEHALTGDSHVAGPPRRGSPDRRAGGTAWSGPGGRWTPTGGSSSPPTCSAAARGRTGPAVPRARTAGRGAPASRDHRPRPGAPPRSALADALGIDRWALRRRRLDGRHAGARVGGRPSRPGRARLFLAPAPAPPPTRSAPRPPSSRPSAPTPTGRGGDYHDAADRGPHAGLGIARRIAHLTYRSPYELDAAVRRRRRPARTRQGGRYAVESYLDHHADKLVPPLRRRPPTCCSPRR